jgi:hypothetical protein
MAQLIAALFPDPARAERALQALMTAGLSGQRTGLIAGETRATELGSFQVSSPPENIHFGAIPAEDRPLFEEGLRRGGSVLLADIVRDLDKAVRIIETFDPMELEGGSGRPPRQGDGTRKGVDVGAPLAADLTAGMGQGNTNLEGMPGAGTMADDTSTLGTADLRTDEMRAGDQGRSGVAVGGRGAEERAGAPGVLELGPATSLGRVRIYGTG